MAQNNNLILWVIGIAAFVFLILPNLDISPSFAIIQKTVCIEGKISYYDFDSGTVNGKFGKAWEFLGNNSLNIPVDADANATTMWVKNYSKGDAGYYFLAKIKGINYVNAVQSDSQKILEAGPQFGLGFNGSVDDYATYDDLSVTTLKDIYSGGIGKTVCYTTSYEENVSCKEYAASQQANTGNGCLAYSGTFYPNCSYEWKPTIQYKVESGLCKQQYYCSVDSLTLTQCNQAINVSNQEEPTVTTSEDAPDKGEGLSKEMFQVAGYSIKMLHLIILLVIIIVLIYFNRK